MEKFKVNVDARELERGKKIPIIFGAFDTLKSGEFMELVNDHDPIPLKDRIMDSYKNEVIWEYIEQGPHIWRIAIGRK